MWWPGTRWRGGGIFRRHYRGHCPPEIIKLKSNYGLIIVNPPPIPKAFCARNLDGIEGREGARATMMGRIAGRMTSFWECSDELFEARNLSIQRDYGHYRGTKLFAVNVTSQLRWFRCLWQVSKRIGEAGFPGGKTVSILKNLAWWNRSIILDKNFFPNYIVFLREILIDWINL